MCSTQSSVAVGRFFRLLTATEDCTLLQLQMNMIIMPHRLATMKPNFIVFKFEADFEMWFDENFTDFRLFQDF